LWRLGFELRASCLLYHLSHTFSPFVLVILEMGVSKTICLDWPPTVILPILASQVNRIIGMSHRHLALYYIFINIVSTTKTKAINYMPILPVSLLAFCMAGWILKISQVESLSCIRQGSLKNKGPWGNCF
jgi:hypothetical protein